MGDGEWKGKVGVFGPKSQVEYNHPLTTSKSSESNDCSLSPTGVAPAERFSREVSTKAYKLAERLRILGD